MTKDLSALTGSRERSQSPLSPPIGFDPERIVAAAICYGGITASVPQPGRHHDVIREWHRATGQTTGGKCEQGFVTSEGRFVDRKEGLRIADRAAQIVDKQGDPFRLFSEDLW